MRWIKAHYLTFQNPTDEYRPTLINSDHIARVRPNDKGKAVIIWAVENREILVLQEPYDAIITQILA